MGIKLARTILSGVLGAVLVYAIVRLAGVAANRHADLCDVVGSSLTGVSGGWSWLLGAAGQLVLGIVAAMIYAVIFEWVTQRAGAVLGFILALAHVAIAGLAVGFLPAGRLIEASIAPPGAFMEYRGVAVASAFVVAHLVFGTVVGILYGRPRRTLTRRTTVWREV